MPDITMCKGEDAGLVCRQRESCYRYKAVPCHWQSWFAEAPMRDLGRCDSFVEMWQTEPLGPTDGAQKVRVPAATGSGTQAAA